jgi:hypothetical protein
VKGPSGSSHETSALVGIRTPAKLLVGGEDALKRGLDDLLADQTRARARGRCDVTGGVEVKADRDGRGTDTRRDLDRGLVDR